MRITFEPAPGSSALKTMKRKNQSQEQRKRSAPKLEIDEQDLERMSDAIARNEAPASVEVLVMESRDHRVRKARLQFVDDDPEDDARPERQSVRSILESPEMLSAEEFGRRCGVSRQTVNTWRVERRVLALSGPKRRFLRYPAWQITDRGELLAGLEPVLATLTGAWEAYDFLTGRWGALDHQPAWAALAAGRGEDVMKALESYRSADYQ